MLSEAGRESSLSSTALQSNLQSEQIATTITQQSSEVTQKILQLLSNNAGFLVEDKVIQAIKRLEKEEEGNLLRVDSILRALGIETPEEMDKLLNYFIKEVKKIDEVEQFDTSSLTYSELESGAVIYVSESNQLVKLVSPQNVVKILKQFIEDQQRTASLQSSVKQRTEKVMNAEERRKDRKRKEEQEFWKRMANCIPEVKFRTWGALEQGLEKYTQALMERAKLIDETEMIRMQNAELKDLLQQYLSQKV